MKLLRLAYACHYTLKTLIVFIKKAVSEYTSKFVSVLETYRFSVCLGALERYWNFFISRFPVPFVHPGDLQPGEAILCPAQGLRKYMTLFFHAIALSRACCFLPLVLRKEFQSSQNGIFTSDLWFAVTFYSAAAAMVVVWAKTWQSTGLFCWIHNAHLKLNKNFSGFQSPLKKASKLS